MRQLETHDLVALLIICGALLGLAAIFSNCERDVSTHYNQLEHSNAVLRANQPKP